MHPCRSQLARHTAVIRACYSAVSLFFKTNDANWLLARGLKVLNHSTRHPVGCAVSASAFSWDSCAVTNSWRSNHCGRETVGSVSLHGTQTLLSRPRLGSSNASPFCSFLFRRRFVVIVWFLFFCLGTRCLTFLFSLLFVLSTARCDREYSRNRTSFEKAFPKNLSRKRGNTHGF